MACSLSSLKGRLRIGPAGAGPTARRAVKNHLLGGVAELEHYRLDFQCDIITQELRLRSHMLFQSPAHASLARDPDGLALAGRCPQGLDVGSPRLRGPKRRARPGCFSLWNAHCADSLSMTLVFRQVDSSQSKPESSLLMAGCRRRHSTFFGERFSSWRSEYGEPCSCCPRHVMLRSRLAVICII